jgi:hypothetical protein
MTPDLARGRWQLRAVTAGGAALLLTPAVFTLVYAGRSPGAGAAVGPAIFVAMGLLLARGHAWLRWPLSVWLGLLTLYFANVLYMGWMTTINAVSAPFMAGLLASPALAALTWSRHVRAFVTAQRAR